MSRKRLFVKTTFTHTAVLMFTGILAVHGQTLTTLVSFGGNTGSLGDRPLTPLVQGLDGNLYGTTSFGVNNANVGTIYRLTPDGTFSTIFSFNFFADGESPNALTLGTDGNFYGTTHAGGANDCGTVFKITPEGVLTTLYTFSQSVGEFPSGALFQATDGNFYGTTQYGGTYDYGTFFKITSEGVLTTLQNFTHNVDGGIPLGGVIQATDGNFYGTSDYDDTSTFFVITPSGSFRRLTPTFGMQMFGQPLIQAANGNIYGASTYGSPTGDSQGSVFSMTTRGIVATVHTFDTTAAEFPDGGVIQASNGKLYGTTSNGGTGCAGRGCGTIFSVDTLGNFSLGYKFHGTSDGSVPLAGLFEATDGSLYGTTYDGGTKELRHDLQVFRRAASVR